MEQESAMLTVYFEEPFWVGVLERSGKGRLAVCRVVFGAEPSDPEVYSYFLENWGKLRFSPPVQAVRRAAPKNPKRVQRAARERLLHTGVGTKAQQALKLLQEQSGKARQQARKERQKQEEERRFLLRQQKKKQKHRGR